MKIDLISILPEFFDSLNLSLIGRAQQDGLLQIQRHNLRDFTFDKHRSVDSPPAGGGAGMVMKPEPWALALDHVLEQRSDDAAHTPAAEAAGTGAAADAIDSPVLIIPTPSGEVFTQQTAQQLAQRKHLIFAPARFEGIDERFTEWAETRCQVRRLSIGDYVLNGGESAVVVMVEAITRLIPGVLGNEASLEEESHSDGLLEYPVYTKPAQWRGQEIPEVLLSGNHAKIQAWRRSQAEERTQRIRPDLWQKHQSC
ncbi:tRNA (guanosine(37)-N1)-methyltransferase TrmD [Nesterenkonia sphaerica]|uniref:tRNA (guanine-N(1)-)-methyltransferase n=1 Tax=Nesterenkonia sphaerica TaxID=1804988 RepID=A0A5R9ANC8_9MICC|nr:tRNA (guanosine(37)-N1)-methyltransferase TrmD [Nesterenkonia sphaerica]TLP79337.1 tRNA (guanosine(37)-N1)-methyltransferase TrmD [Nesterenkonia sphaerica]